MLNQLSLETRAEAVARVEEAARRLGVPYNQARRALYWDIHVERQPIQSLEELETRLAALPDLIRRYNADITLRQIRQSARTSKKAAA